MQKKTEVTPLPFLSPEFAASWAEWLEYRKQRNIAKYVPIGLKRTFSKLVKDSDNNEEAAIDIINHSIEMSYQGLYPRKIQQNGFVKGGQQTGNGKVGTSQARIDRAKEW